MTALPLDPAGVFRKLHVIRNSTEYSSTLARLNAIESMLFQSENYSRAFGGASEALEEAFSLADDILYSAHPDEAILEALCCCLDDAEAGVTANRETIQ